MSSRSPSRTTRPTADSTFEVIRRSQAARSEFRRAVQASGEVAAEMRKDLARMSRELAALNTLPRTWMRR